jgi:hypothetical protein
MLPLGLLLTLLAWTTLALAAAGLVFWFARWFPRQRWLAPSAAVLFFALVLLARHSKWALVLLVLLFVVASAFIPRKPPSSRR